jgi:hypothetical protein
VTDDFSALLCHAELIQNRGCLAFEVRGQPNSAPTVMTPVPPTPVMNIS